MPEEWDRQLAVLRESLIVLPQLLKGLAPDRLRRVPAPGEWSAHVVVCHLVLDEMNTATSLRLILTQDRPTLSEIEDDRCAERFARLYPDTETALRVWCTLREDNLRLCASVSPDERGHIEVTVEVFDVKHLDRVIGSIKGVPGVLDVERLQGVA